MSGPVPDHVLNELLDKATCFLDFIGQILSDTVVVDIQELCGRGEWGFLVVKLLTLGAAVLVQ
jgi:hypothetical protein